MGETKVLGLPFLNDSKQFEMLCRDIMERYYSYEYKDIAFPNAVPFYHLYGRNGQNQHGIDIISRKRIDYRGFCVAQCKNYYNQKDGKAVIANIEKDITEIRKQNIPISRIFIMTSMQRDIYVQDYVRNLIEDGEDIVLMFWEDLSEKILNDSWLHAVWYPEKFIDADKDKFMLDKPLSFHCPLCNSDMSLRHEGSEHWYECERCHRKTKINIFVSQSSAINRKQAKFIKKMELYLKSRGLEPVTLGRNIYDIEFPLRGIKNWMEQCYGLIAVAFRRTEILDGHEYEKFAKDEDGQIICENKIKKDVNNVWITSPFCHIEPAMAFQLELPVLIYREKGVKNDGMLEPGNMAIYMPEFEMEKDIDSFFESQEFLQLMIRWLERVRDNWNRRYTD